LDNSGALSTTSTSKGDFYAVLLLEWGVKGA
jgi:hypothetical protein